MKSVSTTLPIPQRRLIGVHWFVETPAARQPLSEGEMIIPHFAQNPTPGAALAPQRPVWPLVLSLQALLSEYYSFSSVLQFFVFSSEKPWCTLRQFELIYKHNFPIGIKCLADHPNMGHSVGLLLSILPLLWGLSEALWMCLACSVFCKHPRTNSTVVSLCMSASLSYRGRPQITGSQWQHLCKNRGRT